MKYVVLYELEQPGVLIIIPMSIIKESICLITAPLTHIFNLSIAFGIVPTELKTARVIPLFETDDKSLISNHRPISVLPSFSKILEKVVYNRLMSYLNTYIRYFPIINLVFVNITLLNML